MVREKAHIFVIALLSLLITSHSVAQSSTTEPFGANSRLSDERADELLGILEGADADRLRALENLGELWSDHLAPALLEFITLEPNPEIRLRAIQLMQEHTGQDFQFRLNDWFAWVWQQQFDQPDYYADFKAELYKRIDPVFEGYFSAERPSLIQLDEVRWGGVKQDGIPPLRQPKMIAAADADYMQDDNIVFGLSVNGDFRAYPKRILAWHEMFVDTVGEVPVVGVYCTLCGSMILYDSTVSGIQHELGTSGFLYRSNKLMYDRETESLWSTLQGTPVIGSLAGKGIQLPRRSVVTTTWGEWKRRHPDSLVLSLETGYSRDYGEGVAYREYFSTDELMFNTSQVDDRLSNKAEILGILNPSSDGRPLAISAEFAMLHPLLHDQIGTLRFVVLTDHSGAMRVYETGDIQIVNWNGDSTVTDTAGQIWSLMEDHLISDSGQTLARLPSHNAFWFGWYGAYTNTRLLH